MLRCVSEQEDQEVGTNAVPLEATQVQVRLAEESTNMLACKEPASIFWPCTLSMFLRTGDVMNALALSSMNEEQTPL